MAITPVYSARARWASCLGVLMGGSAFTVAAIAPATAAPLEFTMVRSAAAQAGGCLANVRAHVTVTPLGPVERLRIRAVGLPANTEFDVFVIQVPNAQFGLS